MSRYLTDAGKAEVLAEWAKARLVERPADRAGGHGFPDPEIFPLCDAVNALSGICTLQSCCGHGDPASEREPHYDAHLWLWMNETAALRFYVRAAALADHPLVEQTAVLWGRGREREVIEIVFHGANRGALEESSAWVLRVLRRCAGEDA